MDRVWKKADCQQKGSQNLRKAERQTFVPLSLCPSAHAPIHKACLSLVLEFGFTYGRGQHCSFGLLPSHVALHFSRRLKAAQNTTLAKLALVPGCLGALVLQHSCQNGPLLTGAAEGLHLVQAPLHAGPLESSLSCKCADSISALLTVLAGAVLSCVQGPVGHCCAMAPDSFPIG